MTEGLIGLMADTHSDNRLLRKAISTLKKNRAQRIIHLGDICDSMNPKALDEAVGLLKGANVSAVLGNNDYIVLADGLTKGLKKETLDYLKSLPFTITMGDITFTHSSPFEWPAATRRPIMEFIHGLNPERHRLIFRGHSHTPSVLRVASKRTSEITVPGNGVLKLEKEPGYIVTVGAAANGSIALFDPLEYEVRFMSTGK